MRAGDLYSRHPAVSLVELEGQFFLLRPRDSRPYPLDSLTGGIWRLLEAPFAWPEVFEALAEAFPEEPPDQLADDSARALADLLTAGLVRRG